MSGHQHIISYLSTLATCQFPQFHIQRTYGNTFQSHLNSHTSYRIDSIELMKPFNLINKHATASVAVKSIKISRIGRKLQMKMQMQMKIIYLNRYWQLMIFNIVILLKIVFAISENCQASILQSKDMPKQKCNEKL